MDRGAWWVTVPGVARVRLYLATDYHHTNSWLKYIRETPVVESKRKQVFNCWKCNNPWNFWFVLPIKKRTTLYIDTHMYMYLCISLYLCIYVYIYTHICIYRETYMYLYIEREKERERFLLTSTIVGSSNTANLRGLNQPTLTIPMSPWELTYLDFFPGLLFDLHTPHICSPPIHSLHFNVLKHQTSKNKNQTRSLSYFGNHPMVFHFS